MSPTLPDHLLSDDNGDVQNPTTPHEWDDWVSASRTRNHVLGNPLLDWLDRYGESKGFHRDEVDETTDFAAFIMGKGNDFEEAVVEYLRLGGLDVHRIGSDDSHSDSQSLDLAAETWKAMTGGAEAIHQGVLRDPESRTYGRPDLLVRSDQLALLFPNQVGYSHAPAPKLGIGQAHYVVVDIKYTTLDLKADGTVGNSESKPAYKVQLYIYNMALARAQGYPPEQSFLLGRGWRDKDGEGSSFMDRLGPVAQGDQGGKGRSPLSVQATQAVEWVRELRRCGSEWEALPEPSDDRLRPLAGGDNGAWSGAVKQIADETGDLTSLWQVSASNRDDANRVGITSWRDPRATAESLGVTGSSRAPTLNAILNANRAASGDPVRPTHINARRDEWHPVPSLEFFVDFETVSNLDDDFSRLPNKGGQPLIFMVGCGHVMDGEWGFECFTSDDLTLPSEAAIIADWTQHMRDLISHAPSAQPPKVYHWSAAERYSLEAARGRHPHAEGEWGEPGWFDLLEVFKGEPVVVRGAMGFGLKEVATAMHREGLIETAWAGGPADGMGAMVGAWHCQREVDEGRAERLIDTDLMGQIRDYNRVDCKTMMEILRYMRENR